jgi:hypothetical protein
MENNRIFTSAAQQHESLALRELVRAEIFRADGGVEEICVNDLIVNTGRIYLAKRIASGDSVASAMAYMAVGTVSTAADVANTTLTGEVKRKALSTNSALTNNVYTAVMTLGGAADSVTSLSLVEAGVFNHASSGQGTMFQRVTFSAVVLANSDLLKITLETNVGSNTI